MKPLIGHVEALRLMRLNLPLAQALAALRHQAMPCPTQYLSAFDIDNLQAQEFQQSQQPSFVIQEEIVKALVFVALFAIFQRLLVQRQRESLY